MPSRVAISAIPANRACATLKSNNLALKAFIARQDDAATVQKRQEIAEQFTLGLLGQVIRDAMLAEQLARKLAGVSVAGHTADRDLDGRIDDPNGGWKGRGIWASAGNRTPFHVEGGKGTLPKLVKFQLRPDPLAH